MPGAADGEDRIARLGGPFGPAHRSGRGGVDVEHDEVAVDVGTDHRALLVAAVGEGHARRPVAQVVGVGQHLPRRDDDPGASTVSADGDDRGGEIGEDAAGGGGQFVEDRHGYLLLASN